MSDLVVRIVGDSSKLTSAFRSAEGEAQSFAGRMGSAIGTVAKVAGAALVAAKGAATIFGVKAVGAASDLNETLSKTETVFGKAAARVLKFGDTSATALGQSKNEALSAAATYGNLLRAIGLTEDKSADMSVRMTQLASDLASFNNTPVDQALEALRSGLVGETEPLKKFGVNLNEAILKQKALELGLSDGKGTLDASAKAQAAYALILEQTTLAQGDFAKTSGGLANQQRILSAKFADLTASIGQALLPVAVKLVSFANEKLLPIFTAVGGGIKQVIEVLTTGNFSGGVLSEDSPIINAAFKIRDIITGLIDTVKGLFQGGQDAAGSFKDAFGNLVGGLASAAGSIAGRIIGAFNGLKQTLEDNREQIRTVLSAIGDLAGFLFGTVLPILAKVGGVLLAVVGFGFQVVITIIGTAIRIVQGIAAAFGELSVTIPQKFGEVVAFVKSIPGKILSALGNLGSLLIGAGKSLVQGLIDGVKSMGSRLINAILKLIPGPVRGIVEKALGISSPSKVFFEYGENLVQGLVGGLESAQSRLAHGVGGFAGSVQGAGAAALTSAAVATVAPAAGIGGGTVVVNISGGVFFDTERDLVSKVQDGLLAAQRRNGSLGFN